MMNECNNNQTTPEKKKLSLDQHLDGTGDNITNYLKNPLDEFIKENNIDLRNNDNVTNDFKGSLDRFTEKYNIDLSNKDFKGVTGISLNEVLEYAIQNEKLILDIDDEEDTENDCLLKTRKEISFMPRENICVVVAPKKSGKSSFIAIIVASVLGCGRHFDFIALKDNFKVLIVDTEQSEKDQRKCMKYIWEMCKKCRMSKDEFRKRFYTMHARSIRGETLRKRVESEIITYKPDLVVIDGVAQMAANLMDQEESAKINDQLQSIAEAYKCVIMCVIHTSKKNRNDKDYNTFLSKGALGTMLEQGMSDGFVCVKTGWGKPIEQQFFTVYHESRHEEITEFSFVRDPKEKGLPKPYYKIKVGDDKEKVCNTIKQIFADNGNIGLSKGDLIAQIEKKLGKGFSRATLENKWEKLIAPIENELCITPKGRSTIIKLKDPNDPEQTDFNIIAEPDQPTEEAPF